MKDSLKRKLAYIFIALIVLYPFIGYKYDFQIIFSFSVLYSLAILIDSIRYRIRRDNLIELGEEEHFHKKYISYLFLILFVLFIFFGVTRIEEFDIFPQMRKDYNINFSIIIFLPQLIQFILGIAFKEMGVFMYATKKGILYSMNTQEKYQWEDFNSYKIISDQKLLRFEKKNLKYLFISYEEKYFNKYREEILTILDKKLTRE